jgi:Sap, sulfolipid-1-addressing protein
VLAQAAGLALLSALSPTALLITAVYLGSARPGLTSLFYLAGAVLVSVVMGVVVLFALRSAGLNHPDQRAARYGLRLGLGALLLAAAFIATRKPRSRTPAKVRHGLLSRMVADPAPLSAFVVGLLVFAPGVTFIAALQVIATARADLEVTTLAVLLVVVINVLLVWLPITLHLVAPHATEKRLKAFNSWLRANGRTVLTGVLAAAGGIMLFDGIYGLITRSG